MSRKRTFTPIATPVAEGVRVEIGEMAACAVRNEQRDIAVRVRREPRFFRDLLSRIPLLRGPARLMTAIARFFSGLNLAADLEPQRVVRGGRVSRSFAALFQTTPQTLAAIASAVLICVILAASLLGIPMLAEAIFAMIEDLPRFAVNAVCCAFRVAGALLAVYLIARLRVVNRLCMYRGAASKAFNAYEAYGPNFSHEDALLSSRLTDRSDGAFCLLVLVLSIILFACFRVDGLLAQLAFRAGGILAISAVTNEFVRPIERAKPETIGAALRCPLTALQQLFTIEPHNQMIEVAVQAFHAAYENQIP